VAAVLLRPRRGLRLRRSRRALPPGRQNRTRVLTMAASPRRTSRRQVPRSRMLPLPSQHRMPSPPLVQSLRPTRDPRRIASPRRPPRVNSGRSRSSRQRASRTMRVLRRTAVPTRQATAHRAANKAGRIRLAPAMTARVPTLVRPAPATMKASIATTIASLGSATSMLTAPASATVKCPLLRAMATTVVPIVPTIASSMAAAPPSGRSRIRSALHRSSGSTAATR
jgi:hypothetical protein